MLAKKLTKRKKPKKDIAKAKKKRAKQIDPIQPQASSYAELLINITSSGKDRDVGSSSFALHSLLCCASPDNIVLANRLGIFVGRSIYRSVNGRNLGVNDYLDKLSIFFDASGFNSSYHIFPNQIEFDIWEETDVEIGIRSHPFEAGIISGFLSALFVTHIKATEEGCRYSGSWACRFITNVIDPLPVVPASGLSARNLFIHMRDSEETKNKVSRAYDALLLSLLSKPDFQKDAFMLMGLFGHTARSICPIDKHYIMKWLKLIGLGSASVRNKFIYVELDKSASRMETVRLFGAFISGLFNKHPTRIEISMNKGSYRLRFER